MITIFPCGSRRSNWVHSGSAVFLRLLVGELGTPKLAQIFAYMANGCIHTECYYTARQIWTKDVWKRAILRTDVLSYQISHQPACPTAIVDKVKLLLLFSSSVSFAPRSLTATHVHGPATRWYRFRQICPDSRYITVHVEKSIGVSAKITAKCRHSDV